MSELFEETDSVFMSPEYLVYSFLSCLFFSHSAPDTKGKNGAVSKNVIRAGELNGDNKRRYPVELLKIMKRKAEDELLGDPNSSSGKDGLEFIKSVVAQRKGTEIELIKKGKFNSFGLSAVFLANMAITGSSNVCSFLTNPVLFLAPNYWFSLGPNK